jgi:hypothetical protein
VSNYFLSAHTHFCESEDGIIFLDLRTRRYTGLASPHAAALRALVREWPTGHNGVLESRDPTDHDCAVVADALVKQGILTRSRAHGREPAAVCSTATQSIEVVGIAGELPAIHLHHVANFVCSSLWAAARLRRAGMVALIRDLERAGSTVSNDAQIVTPDRLRRLLTIFVYLRPWFYTARDACLFDSIALLKFMAYYRIGIDCVLGVVSKPFRAHCWVQYQDWVLNDSLEHVQDFVPILRT